MIALKYKLAFKREFKVTFQPLKHILGLQNNNNKKHSCTEKKGKLNTESVRIQSKASEPHSAAQTNHTNVSLFVTFPAHLN